MFPFSVPPIRQFLFSLAFYGGQPHRASGTETDSQRERERRHDLIKGEEVDRNPL